jgi:DNA-binding HxlR family transcriptional regulator
MIRGCGASDAIAGQFVVPPRYAYTLTAKGIALGEVLLAFVNWGTKHIPGTKAMKMRKAHT